MSSAALRRVQYASTLLVAPVMIGVRHPHRSPAGVMASYRGAGSTFTLTLPRAS